MTKRTTYLAWIALLSTMAVPASAAQIVANFTVNVSGSADADYLSTPFDLFDPSLGTLTSVTETVTGPLTWLPGDPGEELRLVSSLSGTGQVFFAFATGGATPINVNLNAVAPAPTRFEGQGTFQETLIFLGGDSLSGDPLSGKFTYTFTPFAVPPVPPAVPEPSTWAMMLIGFAGLGYAAVRRKPAVRA
jgi:PEP-CTERM motif